MEDSFVGVKEGSERILQVVNLFSWKIVASFLLFYGVLSLE